jgi:hypothetical protein
MVSAVLLIMDVVLDLSWQAPHDAVSAGGAADLAARAAWTRSRAAAATAGAAIGGKGHTALALISHST